MKKIFTNPLPLWLLIFISVLIFSCTDEVIEPIKVIKKKTESKHYDDPKDPTEPTGFVKPIL